MFDFLTKIAAASNKELMDKISELAPIIIIGLIWLFSAIAKVVAGKKGVESQPEQKLKAKPAQPGFNNLIKMVKQKYAEAQEQIRKESEQGAQRIEPPAQRTVERPAQPTRPKPAMAMHHPTSYQYKQSFATGPMQSYGPRHIPPISSAPLQRDKTIKPPLFEKTIPVAQEDIEKPGSSPKEVKIAEPVHKIGPHPYMTELLKQYAQPNGLRKAFLNYEIFGKPIALRESIQSLY